jgi:hypothetical protein
MGVLTHAAHHLKKLRQVPKGPTTPADAAPWAPRDEGNFEQQRDNHCAGEPGDDAGQWSGGPN